MTSQAESDSSDFTSLASDVIDSEEDFDPGDPNQPDHMRRLEAKVAIEADAEHSHMTARSALQLARSLISHGWARTWLSTRDPKMRTLMAFWLLKANKPNEISQMYHPKNVRLTISDCVSEMEIRLERGEPLSDFI